jgi:uroporphyrin-III C-methyltransferase / precorrin-2 dehydrogenase / sirohydrochlorin ferrochelatase
MLRTTLAELPETMVRERVRPPAVWIVGGVVDLAPPRMRAATMGDCSPVS